MHVVQLEPDVVEREKPILRSFAFKSRFQNFKTKKKFEGSSKPTVLTFEEKGNEKPNTQSNDKEEKEKQMPEEQSKKKRK